MPRNREISLEIAPRLVDISRTVQPAGLPAEAAAEIAGAGAAISHSPALGSAARAASPAAACTPSQLIVSLNTLSEAFRVSAGWPVGLSVNAADDCKNPLVAGAGSVWAHFDNGEDDVPLTALGDAP